MYHQLFAAHLEGTMYLYSTSDIHETVWTYKYMYVRVFVRLNVNAAYSDETVCAKKKTLKSCLIYTHAWFMLIQVSFRECSLILWSMLRFDWMLGFHLYIYMHKGASVVYSGSAPDYWPTGWAIDPAPGTWFITKFISFAQVVSGQV